MLTLRTPKMVFVNGHEILVKAQVVTCSANHLKEHDAEDEVIVEGNGIQTMEEEHKNLNKDYVRIRKVTLIKRMYFFCILYVFTYVK